MDHRKLLEKKGFTLFLAMGLVLLGFAAYFISTTNTKQDDKIGITPTASGVKFIPSLIQCSPTLAKNIEVRWTRSYLITSFAGLSDKTLAKIKTDYSNATGLLVLESEVKTTTKTGTSSVNISDLFKLNKGGLRIDALDGGNSEIKSNSTSTMFTYIPVDTSLTKYDVEFCDSNSKSGTVLMKLDFNSDMVKVDQGNPNFINQ